MRKLDVRFLCEASMMIALGTVLSLFKPIDLPLGGGVTVCSMLPLVIIGYRYGILKGLASGFVYSVIQLMFGVENIQYATSFIMVLGIVFFDYIIAYTVIGLSGLFRNVIKNQKVGLAMGITVTFFLRFICHFMTGVWIWEALWPNELGYTSVVYSFVYNGSYMGLELLITLTAAMVISFLPNKYLTGDNGKS